MTESSEKTMSRTAIWARTAAIRVPAPALAMGLLAHQAVMDLAGALGQEEEPAADEDEVAAGELAREDLEKRVPQAS